MYPLSLGFVMRRTLNVNFTKPVTIVVGENGAGKSTLLEAIATACGFNVDGGSASHRFGTERASPLTPYLRFSWKPRVHRGFFMRAESFFNFAGFIDEVARDEPTIYGAYGGKSLHDRSHGEAFLALFENRFSRDGIYLLDEPEAALSPSRQMAFLAILKELERQNCQVIMATHSPLLMAYPGAMLLEISEDGLRPTTLEQTSHYLILREFFKNPVRFMSKLFDNDEGFDD